MCVFENAWSLGILSEWPLWQALGIAALVRMCRWPLLSNIILDGRKVSKQRGEALGEFPSLERVQFI